jgi:hypothetical protein
MGVDIGTKIHIGKRRAAARQEVRQLLTIAPKTKAPPPLRLMPLFEPIVTRLPQSWQVTYGVCDLSNTSRYWVRSRFGDVMAAYETLESAIGDIYGRVLDAPDTRGNVPY